MPAIAVAHVAFVCGCGYGQKNDGSGEWDEKTFLKVLEGDEPRCPNPACAAWHQHVQAEAARTGGDPKATYDRIEQRAFGRFREHSRSLLSAGSAPVPSEPVSSSGPVVSPPAPAPAPPTIP